MHYWPWYLIEKNITLCVTGLSDNHKHVANGEILGVTLMMEDLLACGACSHIFNDTKKPAEMISAAAVTLVQDSTLSLDGPSSAQPAKSVHRHTSKLIQNYRDWQWFLMTWKRCELLKLDWGRRKLGVASINNSEVFGRFW
jgi:hypothetical protein